MRSGAVSSARFSPDGLSAVVSGNWTGSEQTLEHRLDALEARALGLSPGRVVGLVAGEIATLTEKGGVLARSPLEGGSARVVAEAIRDADWARDGSAFAIVRRHGAIDRLEYPVGRSRYETPGALTAPRVSPDGRRVAFVEQPVRGHVAARIGVVEPGGEVRFLGEGVRLLSALAWSPDGREIWLACGLFGQTLEAWSHEGRRRALLRLPGQFRVLDVSPAGTVLLATDDVRRHARALFAGGREETDLTHLDRTFLMDLAPDGRSVLFADLDLRIGRQTAYVRRAGEDGPVRIEIGEAQSLSPDGSRVTLFVYETDTLHVVPTGAGDALTLPRGTIEHYSNSRWLPDGRRILIAGQEAGRPKRLFLQDVPDGLPQPVTPEGIVTFYPAISPDGRWVAAGLEQPGSVQAAWPVDGGEPQPLRGLQPGDWVVRWSGDGRFVFTYDIARRELPWRVFRVDLRTGRREVVEELRPPDADGVTRLSRLHVAPDGRSYAYGFVRLRSELYLVSGLR
jgi:Tol biopolymer transport system component